MIPRLSLRERILAWLIWHFERFDIEGMEQARICIDNPILLNTRGLLSDYWYIRKARETSNA